MNTAKRIPITKDKAKRGTVFVRDEIPTEIDK